MHLGDDVELLFTGAPKALVVAPFVTRPGLRPLIAALAPGGRLDLVTRWELAEIHAGVSDPLIIDDVAATGGTVRLLPGLHAKAYLCGGQGLVGSANPTLPGLGFGARGNVELLVAVREEDPPLVRLLEVVQAMASLTDREHAEQLIALAAELPDPAAIAQDRLAARRADWIPQTRVPDRVVECYLGHLARDDYQRDVDAVGAPTGLSREQFIAHVRIALQQGLIGRIYRECCDLQQWSAVERMRDLLAAAGVDMTDEEPLVVWTRVRMWFAHYLGTRDYLYGGFTV